MKIREREVTIKTPPAGMSPLRYVSQFFDRWFEGDSHAVRFVVTKSSPESWICEIAVAENVRSDYKFESVFRFRERRTEPSGQFSAVLIVPTGVGVEVGGHAGDATAAALMLSKCCDRIILHPNVVNASDINEMPSNALYVEGSVLTRFLMGTVGLQPVKSNRVLAIVDHHHEDRYVNAAVNTVNAARATYGLHCDEIVCMSTSIGMWGAKYTESGRSVGTVEGLDEVLDFIKRRASNFDAVAISSVIRVPVNYHMDYFDSGGDMINPWGGVEAMLTHSLSSIMNVQSAHAPMFESKQIEGLEVGMVEPRLAAEAVSMSFFQCVLKGLRVSPKIISDPLSFGRWGVLSAEDVSCLVIPDGCLGLPTLAALEQGIPVIAVKDQGSVMSNDLTALPWREGQLTVVTNYLEAAGAMAALHAGITVGSVRRPISYATLISGRPIRSGDREAEGDQVISESR